MGTSGRLALSNPVMPAEKSLLTMCAYCKDVRDPLGRWTYVNQGLLDWLEYRLSHGICPSCMAEYFPEFSHIHNPSAKK